MPKNRGTHCNIFLLYDGVKWDKFVQSKKPAEREKTKTTPNRRELTSVGDDPRLGGLARAGPNLFDLIQHIHILNDLSKHHLLPVQPLYLRRADEELRSFGSEVWIHHR
ncbi:hypothetical protein E2542_SST16916 [Spatholobus suberectus]|nr:hypothetical protein E2542_SST16916 [Spatholobus suberectus]